MVEVALRDEDNVLVIDGQLAKVEISDAISPTIVTVTPSSYSNRMVINDIPAAPKAIMVRHRFGWQNRSNVVEILTYDEVLADDTETFNCSVFYYFNGFSKANVTRRVGTSVLPYDYDAENKTLTIKADYFGNSSATFYSAYKVIITY